MPAPARHAALTEGTEKRCNGRCGTRDLFNGNIRNPPRVQGDGEVIGRPQWSPLRQEPEAPHNIATSRLHPACTQRL